MVSVVVLGERNVIIATQENLEILSLRSVNFQTIVTKVEQIVDRIQENMGGKNIEKVTKERQKGTLLEVVMIIGITRETIAWTIEIIGKSKVDQQNIMILLDTQEIPQDIVEITIDMNPAGKIRIGN